jgi:mono/diheme cytochrome c family protein
MKAILITLILIFCVIATLPIKTASAGGKGSETKGRYYFRQNCKACHTKGAKGGEITPLSKTQAQWKIYFTTGKHATRTELLSKVMSEDQLLDVQTYLVAHAADSPQPETCGK